VTLKNLSAYRAIKMAFPIFRTGNFCHLWSLLQRRGTLSNLYPRIIPDGMSLSDDAPISPAIMSIMRNKEERFVNIGTSARADVLMAVTSVVMPLHCLGQPRPAPNHAKQRGSSLHYL